MFVEYQLSPFVTIFVISGWCTIKKLLKISNDEDKDTEDDIAARKEGRITIFIGHMLMRSVVYIHQRRIRLTINEFMIIGLQQVKFEVAMTPESILSYLISELPSVF